MTNLSNMTNLTYDIDLQNCEGNYEVQLTKSLFNPKFEKKELSDVVEMIEQGALQPPKHQLPLLYNVKEQLRQAVIGVVTKLKTKTNIATPTKANQVTIKPLLLIIMQVDVIQILNQEVDVNEMHLVEAGIVGSTNKFFNFKI